MPRNTAEYEAGLNGFLDFAFQHCSSAGTILCPCSKCGFRKWRTRQEAYDHLICKPFPETYTFWSQHGEKMIRNSIGGMTEIEEDLAHEDHMQGRINNISNEEPMRNLINDAFEFSRIPNVEEDPFPPTTEQAERAENAKAKQFYNLLKDAEQPLYEGCTKFSKLSFLVKLYHIKSLCGVSDKAMSMIIELLHDAFEHASIPASSYEAKKVIQKLSLDYTKIHACPNDCMLYWGEDEDKEECKICQTSRWKQ